MKLEELFKSMDKANEFANLVGEKPYVICVSFDGCSGITFGSWKEFKKYITKELAKWYYPQLLAQDINLDSCGCCDCFFTSIIPYANSEFHSSVQLAIYRKD